MVIYTSRFRTTQTLLDKLAEARNSGVKTFLVPYQDKSIEYYATTVVEKQTFTVEQDKKLEPDVVSSLNIDETTTTAENEQYKFNDIYSTINTIYGLKIMYLTNNGYGTYYQEQTDFNPLDIESDKKSSGASGTTRTRKTDVQKIVDLINQGKTKEQAVEELKQLKIKSASNNYKNDADKLNKVLEEINKQAETGFGYDEQEQKNKELIASIVANND